MTALAANFRYFIPDGETQSYKIEWAIPDGGEQSKVHDLIFDEANLLPKPSAVQLARKRFGTVLALRKCWSGNDSVPINRSVVHAAQKILESALTSASSASAPFIVPCANGSLQLEWHTLDTEIEFSIGESGSYSIWIHDRLTGVELEAEGIAARKAFFRAVQRLHSKDDQRATAPVSEAVFA